MVYRYIACVLRCFSPVYLSATPWTAALQAPLSMGFSRQEDWSGWPFPPPGDLPSPGTEPMSLTSPALAGRFFTASATWESPRHITKCNTWPQFPPRQDEKEHQTDCMSCVNEPRIRTAGEMRVRIRVKTSKVTTGPQSHKRIFFF